MHSIKITPQEQMRSMPAGREESVALTDVRFWPRLCEKSHGCYDFF